MAWPFPGRRERLRREASAWVARLNGPCDAGDRAEFQRWYEADPDHAAAYDRIAALFETAGRASRPAAAGAVSGPAADRGPTRPFRYALGAAVAAAMLLAFVLLSARTVAPGPAAQEQFAAFSAPEGESRSIVLEDGSGVLLSPGSRLEVALGPGARRLRLVQGEGRFSVAHERRPFIVAADGAEVLARGTQFVVRVGRGETSVSLIEGRVDVSYGPAPGMGLPRRVARLEPGQRLVVPATGQAAAPASIASADAGSRETTPEMLQFDDTPLSEAVEQVNRHGGPPVRLGDPGLARLRVTGAFRAGDAAGFARSVAAAFDLELERGSRELRLRRRATD